MIRLNDGDLSATIDPGYGLNVRSLRLRDQEHVWTGGGKGHLDGIPLLAPWANRISGLSYFANGRKYALNPELQNLRRDANGLPIHGLVLFSDAWRVTEQGTNFVASRLEFWRYPAWMAQFPFAHEIQVTHRLRNGSLEIETVVLNLSLERMPLSLGYHPYLQLTGAPRDDWRVHIAARKQVILSDRMIPTGEVKALDLPNPVPLAGRSLDHVFTELSGDAFVIEGGAQALEIRFGPKFPVAIVYSPAGSGFVCVEPMAALTDAFNLDHDGIAARLQSIDPGAEWRASFTITPLA